MKGIVAVLRLCLANRLNGTSQLIRLGVETKGACATRARGTDTEGESPSLLYKIAAMARVAWLIRACLLP